MAFIVLSGSLNPESSSRALAQAGAEALRALGKEVTLLDLRDHPLPLCDGAAAYSDPAIAPLKEFIANADGILIAAPVYNYDFNAALKNLVELTGSAWEDKTVGFCCAAGGQASYMSVMGFANSLMLDFRCVIVPRFVYATSDDFDGHGKPVAGISKRVTELADALVRLSAAARG